MRQRLRKQYGFSLVEALVVVSVTVILTTILVLYSRSGDAQVVFFREQSFIVASLLRAKGFAIETFQPELQPGLSPAANPERVCGWGIFFDKDNGEFIVFRDLASGGGQSGCTSANGSFDSASGEVFETFTLPPALKFSCLATHDGAGQMCSGSGPSKISVLFIPPDPEVRFRPNQNAAEAVIELGFTDPAVSSRTATIRVTEGGQVSVN